MSGDGARDAPANYEPAGKPEFLDFLLVFTARVNMDGFAKTYFQPKRAQSSQRKNNVK
jgi:hypothetical protein